MTAVLRALIGFFVLIVLPVLVLFALAPRFPLAGRAAYQLTVPVRRSSTLVEYVGKRDERCSIGELWRMTKPVRDRESSAYAVVRTEAPLHLLRTVAGEYWSPMRDTPTVLEMADEQSEDIYGTERGMVRSGDVVVDVGANVGMFTRKALSRGAKLVVAVEPNPELVVCLRRNFEKEIAEGKVVVYPKGLWDRDAELMLTTNDAHASAANSVAIPRGGKGPVVPLTTMDKMVEELQLMRIDMVKMDIEGAEPQALRGARNTLQKNRPRMAIATEHRESDVTEIPAIVGEMAPSAKVSFSSHCTNVGGRVVPQILFAQ